MNEARGVSARGGGQLIARVGDLRQQVHGFGVGGSSRRERYSTEAIAYGSLCKYALVLIGTAVPLPAYVDLQPTIGGTRHGSILRLSLDFHRSNTHTHETQQKHETHIQRHS